MGKKFGKLLLFVSTVGAAFAGAYYYMKSKKSSPAEEDDYEDLDDDSEETGSDGERSYVSLNADEEASDTDTADGKESSDAKVEEFFDDEDDDDDHDSSLDAI